MKKEEAHLWFCKGSAYMGTQEYTMSFEEILKQEIKNPITRKEFEELWKEKVKR